MLHLHDKIVKVACPESYDELSYYRHSFTSHRHESLLRDSSIVHRSRVVYYQNKQESTNQIALLLAMLLAIHRTFKLSIIMPPPGTPPTAAHHPTLAPAITFTCIVASPRDFINYPTLCLFTISSTSPLFCANLDDCTYKTSTTPTPYSKPTPSPLRYLAMS